MPKRRSKKTLQQRVEGSCGHYCNRWPQLFNSETWADGCAKILCEVCEDWVEELPSYTMPGEVPLFNLTGDLAV